MATKTGIVYLMRNKHNGKVYVGSTEDYETRKTRHFTPSRIQSDTEFNNDKRKYGQDGFEFEVILEMKFFNKKELEQVEDAYIAIHNSIHSGYNTRYNTINIHDDPEYKREKNREYNEKNRDTRNAKQRERWAKNRDTYNAKRREYDCERRERKKQEKQWK